MQKRDGRTHALAHSLTLLHSSASADSDDPFYLCGGVAWCSLVLCC